MLVFQEWVWDDVFKPFFPSVDFIIIILFYQAEGTRALFYSDDGVLMCKVEGCLQDVFDGKYWKEEVFHLPCHTFSSSTSG